MKRAIGFVGCFFFVALSATIARAQVSVLGNIDCGGGKSTCLQFSEGRAGSVSCSCSAACLAKKCPNKTVSAFRSATWSGCILPITGQTTGGTMPTTNPTVVSAVFARLSLAGPFIGSPFFSKTIDDCFNGVVLDEPSIRTLCF
jgi:hypothetical protein